MKEADLFEPVKEFIHEIIGCEKVYAEVVDLDVVGKHGDVYIGIEMKTSLNFKVIEQAVRRKHLVDYMFILVPKPKTSHSHLVIDWVKSLGIGLMYFDDKKTFHKQHVFIHHWGKRQQNNKKWTIDKYIDEELHLVNVGGSKSGETLTPYKRTMDKIKNHLYLTRDWQTINEILDKVETHYSNPKPSTMATLKDNWNNDWVERELIDGKLRYRMREDYRERYWNEYSEQIKESRQRKRRNSKMC